MIDDKTKAEIVDLYQHGRGSIQDYARIYRLSVEEVLEIVGERQAATVEIGGDLVDEDELGPTGRGQVNGPEQIGVPFSTN